VFKGVGESRINLKDYWYHSVYTAVMAQQVYKACFNKRQGPLFVVGLLHNLGLLVVLERLPYLRVDLAEHIGIDKCSSHFERQKLGFNFSEVGAGLLQYWNLPQELIEPIANQHQSQEDSESSMALKVAIRLADAALSKVNPVNVENVLPSKEVALIGIDQQQLDELIEFTEDNIQSVIDIIQG